MHPSKRGSSFWFVCLLEMLSGNSWLCHSEIIPDGVRGTSWDAGDRTRIGRVQGKRSYSLYCYSVSLGAFSSRIPLHPPRWDAGCLGLLALGAYWVLGRISAPRSEKLDKPEVSFILLGSPISSRLGLPPRPGIRSPGEGRVLPHPPGTTLTVVSPGLFQRLCPPPGKPGLLDVSSKRPLGLLNPVHAF